MGLNKLNLAIYIVIAVVVIAAVFLAVRGLISPSYSLTVGMTADLPGQIYPYNATIFRINVTNTGPSQIKDMPLGFYVNDNETDFYNVSVPVHQSATVNITYTFKNPGNYIFKAVADPGIVMKISDRPKASSTISGVHVDTPESPNFYTSMPNGTASENNFFAFSQRGLYAAVIIAKSYGLSSIAGLFSNSYYLGELASIINNVEGATVTYKNGTSINSIWLQGGVSPYWINYVLSAYNITANTTTFNGTPAYFYRSNGVTACTFYQSGWTRLLEYKGQTNETAEQMCSGLNNKYINSFNTSLVTALNSSDTYNYSARMVYTNSSGMGELAAHASNNDTSLSNFFQNGFGTFMSTVTRHSELNVTALNLSCLGLAYSSNALNACSSVILPTTNSPATGYALLNTTEILPNYTFTIYSVVNQTNLLSAHYSAITLLESANTVAPSAPWSSAFKNTCSTGSNSIGCTVNGFNFSTSTAYLSLKNDMQSALTIDSMECSMYAGSPRPVNETVPAHATLNMSITCTAPPIPLASAFSIYNLTTNYTYNDALHTVRGSLNITNFLQG